MKYGYVDGRYAEVLGVEPGTTLEAFLRRYGLLDETGTGTGNGNGNGNGNPPPVTEEEEEEGNGLNQVGNKHGEDWVALDDNQRVSWQELYTLVENGQVEEVYQNGKYYYRWKNLDVPEGKKRTVYENRGGR